MAKKKERIIVTMPLYLQLSKKADGKKYHINLNQYRNWQFHVSNNLKKAYKKLVEPQIRTYSFKKIELTLTFFKGSKRKIDRSNVLSIHEKFFCDALVESGCLEDDNDNFLEATHYYSGGLDRNNPRVEIEITNIK